MTRPKRPIADAPASVPQVGETWFIKIPGYHEVYCGLVDELTELTVVLLPDADVSAHAVAFTRAVMAPVRFARADVKFIERVGDPKAAAGELVGYVGVVNGKAQIESVGDDRGDADRFEVFVDKEAGLRRWAYVRRARVILEEEIGQPRDRGSLE